MAKLPDLGELTKKFDFQKIVSDVKNMVTPGGKIPEPPTGDALAAQIAEAIAKTHQLAEAHAKQAEEISKINAQLQTVYKGLMALREKEKAPEAAKPEAPVESADKTEHAKPHAHKEHKEHKE